jgi:hypothetical protein
MSYQTIVLQRMGSLEFDMLFDADVFERYMDWRGTDLDYAELVLCGVRHDLTIDTLLNAAPTTTRPPTETPTLAQTTVD